MTTLKLILWIVLAGAAIAALTFFQNHYVNNVSYVSPEITSLTALQEKQFQLFVEMNHLLVALSTLAVGAIGSFILNRYKAGNPSSFQTALAVSSWVLAGLSLFAGYLAYEKVLWMLQNRFFDLSNPQFLWVSRAQFWLLVSSLFFLACFLYYGLHTQPPPDAAATSQSGAPGVGAKGTTP
jgi:hypothetical protein